ncbi:MAG: hypothetical protein PQJ44_07000 [Sphaerochaetaceae bacterium]|nr:hypothetical protein [Sphaerochaetaceae bacterium]
MNHEQKMKLAKNYFDMHVTQNKHNRDHKIIDALEYASKCANINIFVLAKELKLEFFTKKKYGK